MFVFFQFKKYVRTVLLTLLGLVDPKIVRLATGQYLLKCFA